MIHSAPGCFLTQYEYRYLNNISRCYDPIKHFTLMIKTNLRGHEHNRWQNGGDLYQLKKKKRVCFCSHFWIVLLHSKRRENELEHAQTSYSEMTSTGATQELSANEKPILKQRNERADLTGNCLIFRSVTFDPKFSTVEMGYS